MRPRTESVSSRPRPKTFCKAEAKKYEAEATVSNVYGMQRINYIISFSYHNRKTNISKTELS